MYWKEQCAVCGVTEIKAKTVQIDSGEQVCFGCYEAVTDEGRYPHRELQAALKEASDYSVAKEALRDYLRGFSFECREEALWILRWLSQVVVCRRLCWMSKAEFINLCQYAISSPALSQLPKDDKGMNYEQAQEIIHSFKDNYRPVMETVIRE